MQVVLINPQTGQIIQSIKILSQDQYLVGRALANLGDAPGVWIFGDGEEMFLGREVISSMLIIVKEV
jgi:hypothetical protein